MVDKQIVLDFLLRNSFSEYYKELILKDLIKEVTDDQGRKYITLTDNGFKYIEKYKLILGFIDEFDL
ncbi:MAG: hypothetical protein KKA62_04900 [Nanoarchaeota archaeon]|nr:hypothetical protein [Nanoarchaeota archaeon]MBU1644285.1 hypothetical protein [Nanoarchaeota archaeon]MBU1977259.1 hypothetical protein [Nanoarchaeota archaeon]